MARGRKSKAKIVPFTKTVTTAVSPDKVPEGAGIEEYEKMAAKVATSDEIIDRALDKLEGKVPEPPQAANVPEEDMPEKDDSVPPPPETEQPENVPDDVYDEKPAVPDVSNENMDLRMKLTNAGRKIKELTEKVESLSKALSERDGQPAGMKQLADKNDDLILRNSELEFEISRLNTENNRLKQELEKYVNAKMLPPQTYSKEAYTRPTPQMMRNQARMVHQRPPRMSMNGYESWN